MSPAFGGQSMVEPLRRVLVRAPDESFAVEEPERWHYASRPDLKRAVRQHEAFMELLGDYGAEVIFHDRPSPGLADSIFVHDPVLVTDHGAVVLSMGKELRRGEEEPLTSTLESVGVPCFGRLDGGALAEGGDLLWLTPKLLAVGQGFRTNAEGIRQLRSLLEPVGIEVLPVELPVGDGPEACLHLQSLISLVASRAALVYKRFLAAPFVRRLADLAFSTVAVPDEEFPTLGTNVLALEPGLCIAVEGNPVTRRRLEEEGVEVRLFEADELCLKAEGGPTCLTLPVLRAAGPAVR